MTTVAVPGVAFGRINWSRPIVDCPSPHCRSALLLEPGTPLYECWDCHTTAPIVWPDNWADIVQVLALRPDPVTRNWAPGESLMDLVEENLLHGILPTAAELAAHSGPLLRISDDRITAGHRALGAS